MCDFNELNLIAQLIVIILFCHRIGLRCRLVLYPEPSLLVVMMEVLSLKANLISKKKMHLITGEIFNILTVIIVRILLNTRPILRCIVVSILANDRINAILVIRVLLKFLIYIVISKKFILVVNLINVIFALLELLGKMI